MTLRPDPYHGFQNDRTYDALERLERIAAERGAEIGALALAWVMAHPQVTSPIVGPRSPTQLDPARRALEIRLTAEERQALSDIFTF
jgi:aryl-alcohol dehydrogenase-like predicted oxidoreductase